MSRKISPKIQEKILTYLKQTPGVPVSRQIISQALGIRKNDYHVFLNSLIELSKAGRVTHVKKMHYAYPQKSQIMQGELRVTRSGFGFVDVEGQDVDVFVNQSNLNTAFDRDIVEIQLYAASRGKRLEGFVTKVIKRFREFIVGTYHKLDFYSYVVPDDPRIGRDIIVHEQNALQAKDGQKVLVRFDRWERNQHNPEGTIVEILGDADTPGVDVVSVAYSFNIPVKFSQQVEDDARIPSDEIKNSDLDGRLDLRDLICFTIDPVDAKDFDDAVSLEKTDKGYWRLGVHIADVSHYVPEGSVIDKEAWQRGTSVYLVDRVIPMLPERLSNHLCSLKPETDRLTFSCFVEFDETLKVINYHIQPSIIHSKRRFNYQEVQEILDGKRKDPLSDVLNDMLKLSKALTKKRFEQGGIDFETPEVRFELDEKGRPLRVIPIKRLDSHRLVEEFMLAANQTVARHIGKISKGRQNLLPFLYRVHEKPDPEKMDKFFELLAALEIPFKPMAKVSSKFFQQILQSIKGSNEETVIEEVALRSMMKAVYSEKNIGHFGLGFKDYTHFTSPIRRYPDLTVHRLLKQYAKDKTRLPDNLINKLRTIGEQSTRMERLAQEAERESVKLKQAEYISDYIGETFTGLVSGVMSFGIFVELHETFIEGIIPIASMLDDFYIHDDRTYSIIGRDTDKVIRLGDEVSIRVESVDMERKRIEFNLLENISDIPRQAGRKKEEKRQKTARRRKRPRKKQ
ncbi:MAG: ribonuclease R [Calditrichaceae bacterium]|nr:ribonuclease R [Calditrichaceae bacterium]